MFLLYSNSTLIKMEDFIKTGSWDRTIKIWDFGRGECLRTIKVMILFHVDLQFSSKQNENFLCKVEVRIEQ